MTRRLWLASALLLAPSLAGRAADKDQFGDPLPEGAKARVGTTRMHRAGGGVEWAGAVLTPDGKFLLSAVRGGPIEKIDVATGRVVGTVGPKDDRRTGRDFVYLSADGKIGASTSERTVIAWDTKTGTVLSKIERPTSTAHASAALSADGSTVAVGDHAENGERPLTALVWDVGAAKRRLEVEVAQTRHVSVALSHDGRVLATWGEVAGRAAPMVAPDTPIQFWDATNGKKFGSFVVEQSYLAAVTFAPDGKSAAVIDGKGAVRFIDPKTGTETRKLAVRAEIGGRVYFAPDGKTLAVGWGDGTVKLWDVGADKELSSTPSPARVGGNGPSQIVLTGAEKAVAWGVEGSKAVVWEVPSGKVLSPREGHSFGPSTLAFTPDGKELLSNGEQWTEWTIQRWDVATGRPLGAVAFEVPANVNLAGYKSVRLRSGTRAVATGPADYLYDPHTGKRLRDLGPASKAVRVSTDGGLTLTPLGLDPAKQPDKTKPLTFAVADPTADGKFPDLELPGPALLQATRTPDGKRLLTVVYVPEPGAGRGDNLLTLWDLATGKKLGEVKEPGDPQWYAPAPGPDSKSVITASAAGELRAIDFFTGKVVRGFDTGGLTPTAGPVLGAGGKLVAVGLCDTAGQIRGPYEVRVYDAGSGKPLKTFRDHTGLVNALAFSPDGKTLASGSHDTTILLWDLTAPK